MHETSWWEEIWRSAPLKDIFASESAPALAAVAACLAFAAAGIASHAYFKGRGKRVSQRSATSNLMVVVWLLPVVGVFLLVALPLLAFVSLRSTSMESSFEELQLTESVSMIESLSPHGDEQPTIRPDWVDAGETGSAARRLFVVSGDQFPERERARLSALDAAVEAVRKDVALSGDWTLAPALVQNDAVMQTYIERIERSTGLNDFVVYRAYHQVEVTGNVREAATASWRSQTVSGRLWIIGGLLGFIVLTLGTAATYLRLDAITEGNYRRRLKLASVSLLIAGGVALSVVLPMA